MSSRLLEILGNEVACFLSHTSKTAFKEYGNDYHSPVDLRGCASHLRVSILADGIKQELPEGSGGFTALNFLKPEPGMYDELPGNHPFNFCRYQVLNCCMGKAGLINSGGGSGGDTDRAAAVKSAVIDKGARGLGLILGRKAF